MKSISLQNLYTLFLNSNGVCTDSRKINVGEIFFALKGNNFNGNLHALNALKSGAKFAIVDENIECTNDNVFIVKNALTTLQNLAKHHRREAKIKLICLTGSNGKTTTKELMVSVLKQKFKVWFTQGNLNNHIGVPLTILGITSHDLAVVEMGANHQKEIKFLSNICEPDIGYITNFGLAHLEGFGGIEGVIKGKAELYDYLRENNKTVLLNIDDEKQVEKSTGINERIIFSTKSKSDNKIELDGLSKESFLKVYFENKGIQSNLTGRYNLSNIAAAITLGKNLGLDFNDIKRGIENYLPENSRSQLIQKNGKKIILDAYNANPTSMCAAIENLVEMKGEKAVILGDMFELGSESKKHHQEIIELLEKHQIKQAFLVGENFSMLEHDLFRFYRNTKELIEDLKLSKINAKNILIKGSRGMKMEDVLGYLS